MREFVAALLLVASPPPVSDLDADVGGSAIHLRWILPADPDVAGIRIQRQEYDTGNLLVFQLDGAATSYADSAVTFDRDYLYTVQVVDGSGGVSAGAAVSVYLGDNQCADGCWSCGVAAAGARPPGAVWIALAVVALAWGLTRVR